MILSVHQYRDRIEAGQTLAHQLLRYAHRLDTLVLALPRGGVPVALQVATELNAPLDVFLVRKLAAPRNPDISVGAITSGAARVVDQVAMEEAGVTEEELADTTARELAELARDEKLYRGNRSRPDVRGRVVILVDDGLATGYSMHAAVIALHQQQPSWLVVATPVGSLEACAELAEEVHELVCPLRPSPLQAIGLWYDHFSPTTDDEVRVCLQSAKALPRI